MIQQIFVNLPVKDLNKSIAFFTELGFTFNAQFTNDDATCMIIGENIFAMLLVEPFFKTFTPKAITNTKESTEVLTALSVLSKAEVDSLTEKALAAGGAEPRPAQDHGFMYSRAFEDLDGHTWELFWMDPANVE